MGSMASKITSLTIIYSTVHSDADQRKHQSLASLAFVRGIHRWSVNSPHKWPATRKRFPFDDVIMMGSTYRLRYITYIGYKPTSYIGDQFPLWSNLILAEYGLLYTSAVQKVIGYGILIQRNATQETMKSCIVIVTGRNTESRHKCCTGPFHERFLHRNSNSMNNSLCCDPKAGHQIAANPDTFVSMGICAKFS